MIDSTVGVEPMPWDDDIDTSIYKKTQVTLKTTYYNVTEIDADGNVMPEFT